MIQIRKGFKIENTLAEISASRTVSAEGRSIEIKRELEPLESFLATALFEPGRTTAFIQRVVKRACANHQELEKSQFLKDARRISNELISSEQRAMKVVFPLWNCDGFLRGRKRRSNVWLNFSPSETTRFFRSAKEARMDQVSRYSSRSYGPSRHLAKIQSLPLAICSVKAVNPFDAVQQAERAMDVEMGVLSLGSVPTKSFLFSACYDSFPAKQQAGHCNGTIRHE